MAAFADADQALVDDAVRALAWSLYRPEHARALAELAVADTGLGNVADKIAKNQRKTFGTLRDLLRVRTVGVIEEDPARGIVKYAKPVGVVGAITPSTNPAATPVNKAMMALKGRNAIVIAPSPAGWTTTARAVDLHARRASPGSGLPAGPRPGRAAAGRPGAHPGADAGGRSGRLHRQPDQRARGLLAAARRRSASAPATSR